MKRNMPFQGEVVFGAYSGLRKLARALRRGTLAARPISKKALRRHKWYRGKVSAAQLRIAVGQALPGDKELVF